MTESTEVKNESTGELQVVSTSTSALILDSASMDSMMRVAELMSSGKATVPAHLRQNPADCMAVIMQAIQWRMNPFAVAQKTHLVNGVLGYEAQLVNAVMQASNSISGRFHYEYEGEGAKLACRVGAVVHGETDITWGLWLSIDTITTKNSPLWKTNPKQQMGYLQVKNWSRLYCPGALLGVYTPDELEEARPTSKDITPNAPTKPDAPEPSPELVDRAAKAAVRGVAEYSKFWADAGKESRALLKHMHEEFKADAIAADKNRTLDAGISVSTQHDTSAFDSGLGSEYVPE